MARADASTHGVAHRRLPTLVRQYGGRAARLAAAFKDAREDEAGRFRVPCCSARLHASSKELSCVCPQRPGLGRLQVEELLQEVTAGKELTAHRKDEFDQEVLEESRLRVHGRVDARIWDAFRLQGLEGRSGAEPAERTNGDAAVAAH